jgi:hypothetical protein
VLQFLARFICCIYLKSKKLHFWKQVTYNHEVRFVVFRCIINTLQLFLKSHCL